MTSAEADQACKSAMADLVRNQLEHEDCFAQASASAASHPERDVIEAGLLRQKRSAGTLSDFGEFLKNLDQALADYRAALSQEARAAAVAPPDKAKKLK